jgi:ankyrin repeat protein
MKKAIGGEGVWKQVDGEMTQTPPEPADLAALDKLIAAGEPLEAKGWADKCTALAFAAGTDKADAMAALLKAGADSNAQDKWGSTPLMRAAQNNCIAAGEALIAAGADVLYTTDDGSTALKVAKMYENSSSSPEVRVALFSPSRLSSCTRACSGR